MDRWSNRVAVVTGASSGIGAAIVKYLANNGMITVGLARRKDRIEALRNEVKADARKRIHAIKCDITKEDEIKAAFKEIETKYGPVAVLVNNAGIARSNTTLLSENNSQDIRDVVDTNIMGVVHCTREAFRTMKANGGDGHVFLINSIAGHKVPVIPNITVNIYPPTKYAVTAMTEVYRQELANLKTNIKVTSISPGVVDTEIITEEMRKNLPDLAQLKADDIADALIYCLQTPPRSISPGVVDTEIITEEMRKKLPDLAQLKADDIADALIYCLQTPPRVQIHELTIKSLGEMF